MKYSVKTQIMLMFISIIAFTMILCVGLNKFFLKDFYLQKKQEKFVVNYEKMAQLINKNDYDDDMNQLLADMRDLDNIAFIRASSSWNIDDISENCVSKVQADELKNRLIFYILIGNNNNPEVSILKKTDTYIIQKTLRPAEGTEYMECYGLFSDGTYFIMSTPLEAVQDSVAISNQFFLIVGVMTMCLAVLAISVLSNRFTKPILQLAEISDKMAHLDFTSSYDGSQNNEIDILGNSMNLMSSQLESTIEELKEANEQLKKDIDEKIQIDEIRKEFLSNVSHELKTPIALIQGYAEGLQESVNDDPESRAFYCDVIIDEAAKMNRMVKKLLTLNHLEFGQDAISIEEFDIAEMLNSLVNSNDIVAQKKNAVIIKNYSSPCMVKGDEFKIEEVCTNYISNAINHVSGENKITISIESEGTRVKITVFNTGEPIPEDSLDKVWIKFYKVDKARTREYGGSGIGLSIVKAIMDAHGQDYGVYNTENGVAFWFCLEKADDSQ